MIHGDLVIGEIEGPFPCSLRGDYHPGDLPAALLLHGHLPRGRYLLQIRLREPEHNQLLVISRDEVVIDALGVPFAGDSDDNWPDSRRDRVTGDKLAFVQEVKERYQLKNHYARRMAERSEWTLSTTFCVEHAGEVTLTIANRNGDDAGGLLFYKGDGLCLLGVKLARDSAVAPNSFARRAPGLPMLDAWGWMAYLGFDNPDKREATPEEIIADAIHAARPWGANLIEVNPALVDGHCFDFEEGPLPGTERSPTTAWNSQHLRRLFRIAREQGMLAELFLFSITGFTTFYKMTGDQIRQVLARINQLLGCGSSAEATAAAIDGAIYELFPHDAPRETDDAWQHNPGLTQTVSGGVTGTAQELQNNGWSAGFANYTAHWVGASVHHTGYDCLFPAVPYPRDFYRRPLQVAYSYLQGSAESRRPAERQLTRGGYVQRGIPGRDAAPDWIFAQLQGFTQRRWRDQDDPVASLLCWEAVAQQICTPDARRMAYAATQDPIRACVTGTLRDTGLAGSIDLRRELDRQPRRRQVRLSRRHAFPHDSRFLRNQDLELLTFPGRDYNLLQLDHSRSARFHGNGELLRPFAPLLITSLAGDDAIEVEESWRQIEAGGTLAECEQQLFARLSTSSFHETRRMRLLSDLPGIQMTLRRTVGTAPQEGSLMLNAMGPADGYAVEILRSTSDTLELAFRDADGVLPEARALLTVFGTAIENPQLKPNPSFTTRLTGVHEVRLRLLFAAGHIQAASLGELLTCDALWEPSLVELPVDGHEVDVAAPSPLSLTRTVQLAPHAPLPCRVREQGWWYYRGITPGDEVPARDFLKLHHADGETVRIARDSRIGGELTWGWGSQYLLLLGDVAAEADGWHSARVRVARITPFVFAPRLLMRDSVAEIELDGRPWHYADGALIFLPNRCGEYRVRWRYGACSQPRLVRTFACITATRQEGDALEVDAELPDFVPEDPGFHGWYALLDAGGKRRVHPLPLGTARLSQ